MKKRPPGLKTRAPYCQSGSLPAVQPRCRYSNRPVRSKAASGRRPTAHRATRASGPACRGGLARRRAGVVGQRRPRRAEVVFECDQTGLVEVRAPEVQFLDPLRLRLLDRAPEQERHAAERVVRGVGPAVLVDQRLPERQRQDAGDGQAVLARQVNRRPVTQARDQIPEPGERLRRQAVPAARQAQQAVESRQQSFGRSGLVAQALALGPPDGALGAGGMKAIEDLLRGPSEIERVQAVLGAFGEPTGRPPSACRASERGRSSSERQRPRSISAARNSSTADKSSGRSNSGSQ